MSPRLLSAISVSMLVHVGLWSGLWQAAPRMSRSKASVLENSIFIDPAAFEAVKKARAATVKNKPSPAVKPPAQALKKLPPPEAKAEKTPPVPPAAEAKKIEKAPLPAAAPQKLKPSDAPAHAPAPTSASGPPAASKTGADLMASPKTRGLFTDYFGSVKARIQQKLREKCAGRSVGSGSVQLAFVLSADGRLHKVYVMDRNSQVDGELKELAIESLRDSAPFSDFPSDFNARQIAFNLTVYFDDL